ncbi:MAG TPA: hypothetical protein VJA66_16930 [Thermoanaerobaculia bacterium]
MFSRSDAAEHAQSCPSCRTLVEEASRLSGEIEALAVPVPPPDIAERVIRLRPFSRRERRSFRIWGGPIFLSGGVFLAGLVILALPGLRAREQASLSLAAALPALALLRALARSVLETLRLLPAGLEAVSGSLAGRTPLGFVCLLLLAPVAFGLRRVLARASRR